METVKRSHISNKDESVRLFQSDFLEALTKVHPVTPLLVFLPIIGYFFYRQWTLMPGWSFMNMLGLFVSGIFFWTFFEYALHRFVFHYKTKNPFGQRLHFLFHGIHHDYPRDSRRLVMPPTVGLGLAYLVYLMFRCVIPGLYLPGFFSGFLFGYLIYDMGHFAIHHFNFKNRWFVMVRNHHFLHHYQDDTKNFGVSSPLWDLIFKS